MSFKGLVESDIKNVFLNTDEHAENLRVIYDNFDAEIPVILDEAMQQDLPASISDDNHGQGIYLVTATLYVAFSDLGVVPKRGQLITVGENTYRVASCANEMGQLVIGLERYGS